MSKPVVVGIAATESTNVLSYAVSEARESKSVLRVVHSAAASPQAADYYAGADMIEELRRQGQVVLDEARTFIESTAPDVAAEYVLDSMPPIMALKTLSAEARLLVVGSDDVPWFERLMRGRISGHLALHVECPVAVVPLHSVSAEHDGDVILTLDGESSADGPIRFAFEQASQRHSALIVLHVALPGTLSTDRETVMANISEVLAGWSADYPDAKVVKTFVDGDPLETITHATERAGLVVVGRPHTTLALIGVTHPLATLVLRRAHSPVAVVPATYEGA